MSVNKLQIAAQKAIRLYEHEYTHSEINDLIQFSHEYAKLKFNQGQYHLTPRQITRKDNIIEKIKNIVTRHNHIVDFSYSCSFGICESGEDGNPFITLGVI